jgi:hypothetical protein
MTDAVMWIAWGQPIHGREERAVEVFGESVAYWGELQAEGRIERFDVALLNPYGDLNGFAVLYGTHKQFAEVAEEERWIRSTVAASLVVENLRMIEGTTGEALAHQIGLFRETASQMPAAGG